MGDGVIRKVVVFSVWCMSISICIIFLQIKHMTPEKTFGLIEQKDFSNRRDEQKINFSKADKFI